MHSLVDIGANLTHDSFDADLAEVLDRSAQAGVQRLIVTGASATGSVRALELAEAWPDRLWATAGVHPHHASDYDAATREVLQKLVREAKVVAVGECGLDFFRNFSPREDQLRAFADQLALAAETDMPVFLHQRDAHREFTDVLSGYVDRLAGGVAHCFTGGPDEMSVYLEMGLYVGITGWLCDERRGTGLRKAIAGLPLDRVLLETDAPYLLPRDLGGKPPVSRRNEPAFLAHILATAARHMGVEPGELAAASSANAERLFGLDGRA